MEFSVADLAIRLAVTVIACEPRSERAREMLVCTIIVLCFELVSLSSYMSV